MPKNTTAFITAIFLTVACLFFVPPLFARGLGHHGSGDTKKERDTHETNIVVKLITNISNSERERITNLLSTKGPVTKIIETNNELLAVFVVDENQFDDFISLLESDPAIEFVRFGSKVNLSDIEEPRAVPTPIPGHCEKILYWGLGNKYLKGTFVLYGHHAYKCIDSHFSKKLNAPIHSRKYWKKLWKCKTHQQANKVRYSSNKVSLILTPGISSEEKSRILSLAEQYGTIRDNLAPSGNYFTIFLNQNFSPLQVIDALESDPAIETINRVETVLIPSGGRQVPAQ